MDQGPHGKPLLSFAFRKSHCESPLSQVSSRSFSLGILESNPHFKFLDN